MRGANFNRRGSGEHILRNVGRVLNTAQPYNRDLNHPTKLVHQPHRYRFHRRTGQPAGRTTETGPPIVCVDTQCRIGIRYNKCVSARVFRRFCYKSNDSNGWRELNPKGSSGSFAHSVYYFRS